ncbi:RagB/SusD family nutrient uptake outer membrane protein [Carboxylicivirga mesophila]|uniref:RagB/SusD family nutrient uptake outer membrane protein n=1 Tax=Carboxylicivirga mesophila TaxID=1166478 RepID=A0ABS5KEI9_9BACT|nr:RagB/SusD family nutrient uptake outer membrane protein [Carboxylicivirga mesophila]MBS2213334.1 RagB/SusD family nutrient uptake outer membrane protein [Carboxylicivirga mesophila]
MKNKILIFTLVMALFAGCDDVLDKEPLTSIPDLDMFTDTEGAQQALNGIYNEISDEDYYGRLMYAFEGSKGPDFYVEDTGNRFQEENGYRESSTLDAYADAAWERIYSSIFLCNKMLSNIDNAEGEADELKRLKGEALALRGLAYFDLMRLFAYPPTFSIAGGDNYNDMYKWGVPLLLSQEDNSAASINPPTREEAIDCYIQILSDLNEAAQLLNGISASDGTISYQAVNALLARTYLYMGQWDNAIAAGEKALGGSSMLAYDNYTTSYYSAYNSESIWELQYSLADNLGSNSLNHLTRNPTIDIPGDPNDGKIADDKIGYAGYGGNVYLREVLNEVDGDVRQYLICDNELGDDTGIRKYIGDGNHSVHNIYMVRLPEVYLTLAESYAEQGTNMTKAAEYMNYVYEARTNVVYTAPATTELLIADILKERRKELVLEGHTFWDHFRRAIPFQREAEGNVSNDVAYIDYTQPQVVYPIPMNEMEANPNIRNQQNPGYAPYTGGQ